MRTSSSLIFVGVLVSSFVGCMATGNGDLSNDRWGTPKSTPTGEAYSRFLAGVLLENRGEFDAAVEQMLPIPELDPAAVTPVLRLIRAHLRKRDFEAAREMALRAVEQQPDAANLWIVLGEIHHQLQDFDAAVNAFSKAIELNPDDVMGYGALAEVQESANDLVAAIEIYEKLIELKPDVAVLHYQLGLNLTRINDAEGAIEAMERTLVLNPNMARAQFLLAALYLQTGQNEQAVTENVAYLRRRPGDIQALENLAGAYGRLGQYAQAIETNREILVSSSVEPKHHLQATYLYLRDGRPAAAEQALPPTGAPVFSQLFLAIARQQQDLPHLPLIETLDEVDGNFEDEVSTHLNELLYFFGKEDASAWLLENLAAFQEEAPNAYRIPVLHGRTLMLTGDYTGAVEVLTPVLLDAKGEEERWLHYYLAVCHEELDHFDETEAHLKAYLNHAPDDPDVLNFLGYFYAEHGVKLDEAEVLLNKALELDPGNPYYLDSLGWIFYKRGEAEEAIELIQQAIYGMDKDDAILRDHLGDAYLLQGDRERAIGEWERAYRLDPSLEGLAEKLERHRDPADGAGPADGET